MRTLQQNKYKYIFIIDVLKVIFVTVSRQTVH